MFPFSFPFNTKCNNFKIQCSRSAYSRPKSLSSACVMHSTDYTVTVQICRLILHCAVVIVGACYHAQCHHTDPVDTNTRYVRWDPICARGCLPHTLWHCATTTLYFILYTAHTFDMLSCLATSISKSSYKQKNTNWFSFKESKMMQKCFMFM